MGALALGLGSSLLWGIGDFLGGLQSRRRRLVTVMLVSQATGLTAAGIALAISGEGPPALHRLLPAFLAGATGMVALRAFYRALAIGTMSIVAPVSASGSAIPVIVGLANGEHPQALQLVGIAAAIGGVVLASREDPTLHPQQREASRLSIGLALMAAVGFGAFFVAMRSSARASVPWALVSARASGVLILVVAAALALREGPLEPEPLRARLLAPLVAVGLFDIGANALYSLATTKGLLSVVAVTSSLYPVTTVVLARVILRERVQRVQELGIFAALAGVVLMAT
jgi:drug/metabolite transporter (DMT)-like permease